MIHSEEQKRFFLLNRFKWLKIMIVSVFIILAVIVALDNYLYRKVESFNVSESFTIVPKKGQTDVQKELLEIPTFIAMDGKVMKKVNPAVITEGFFNYSYLYEFHGIVKIGELELNYNEDPLVSSEVVLKGEYVLLASPLELYTVKMEDQMYHLQITMFRDIEYKLFHFQLVFYDESENIVALYNYEL